MGDTNPVDVVANVATGGLYGAGQAFTKGRPITALAGPLSPASQITARTAGQQVVDATGVSKIVNKNNPFAMPALPGQPKPLEDPLAADRARLEEADKEQAKKRAKAIVSTVLSSPLGVSSGQPVQRSVLSSLGG